MTQTVNELKPVFEIDAPYRLRRGTMLRSLSFPGLLCTTTKDSPMGYDVYCTIREVCENTVSVKVWGFNDVWYTSVVESEKLESVSLEEFAPIKQAYLERYWAEQGHKPNITLPDGRVHVFNPETAEVPHPFIMYIEKTVKGKVKKYYMVDMDRFTQKLEEALVVRKAKPAALLAYMRMNYQGGKRHLYLEHRPDL